MCFDILVVFVQQQASDGPSIRLVASRGPIPCDDMLKGRIKHEIPGFQAKRCLTKGHPHPEGFAMAYPCVGRNDEPASREQLLNCLPKVTSDCVSTMPSRYPDQRR